MSTQPPTPQKKPAKVNVSAPSTGAVTSMLNDHQQNLAIEMAAELETPKEILARYSLTKIEFKQLAATARFKQQYKDAKIAWGSAMNAKERVALKSAMMSEGALLRINQLMHCTDTPPSNVIDAHKHISNLGNLMPGRAGEGDGGTKHSITINLGTHGQSDRQTIEVAGNVIEGEK